MTRPVPSVRDMELDWHARNARFAQRGYRGEAEGPAWEVTTRSGHALVTAVHGVKHFRPGTGVKEQDAATGGLAVALAAALDLSHACLLRGDHPGGDPNHDPGHPFKLALAEIFGSRLQDTLLLDLHGMGDQHGVDIALGVGKADARSVHAAAVLAEQARSVGLRVDEGGESTGYRGASTGSMLSWHQRHGGYGVQVELAPDLRFLRRSLTQRLKLLKVLTGALSQLLDQ